MWDELMLLRLRLVWSEWMDAGYFSLANIADFLLRLMQVTARSPPRAHLILDARSDLGSAR